MCGICGIVYKDKDKYINADILHKMCNTLKHRGPNDSGIYIDTNLGLGQTRLSIIDLSSNGHQPMSNEDGTIWISFNGEIYNFQELKKDLLGRGHCFKSNTDTETIIHLYEEYGVDCVGYLRGMYAFALWDSKKNELFLVRDRIGKKPLYYALLDQGLVFGSEMKAILANGDIKPSVNFDALYYYNTFGLIPSPLTAFEKINKLPPAHYLVYRNGDIHVKRYWDLDYTEKIHVKSEENLLEIIREELDEATKIRMISDVPLGAFLSGGVDSSAVVAFASKYSMGQLKTFSVSFEEKDFDESNYADIVAKQYGTDHHKLVVKPDAVSIMSKLVEFYDEPFADSSAIPTYYVSNMAKQYVTVALSGDGGDENFAGYPRYSGNHLAEYFYRIPFYKHFFGSNMMRSWLTRYNSYNSMRQKVKRLIHSTTLPAHERYFNWISWQHGDELFSPDFRNRICVKDGLAYIKDTFGRGKANTVVDKSLYTDVNLYLPEDLLIKVDIASMSNSLEIRCPFLDHKFMEFAASIPSSFKVKGRETKYILKKALEPMIPREVMYREKMGFGIPVENWFRNELKDMVYDYLLDSKALQRGYYNIGYVRKMIDEHMSCKRNFRFEIWNLLMLELWHRKYID